MFEHYASSGPYCPPGASLGTAGTLLPVGDDEGCVNEEVGAVASEADGLDLDNVEHVRQSRLKRRQMPPTPTRKASG